MMTTGEHDLHTLAGPYVLGSVTDDERSAFEAHLPACAQCGQDVRELRETAARLGTSTAVRPRPELRVQAIRAAHRTSQLAPVMPGKAEPEWGPSRARTGPAARSWPVLATVAATVIAVAGAVGLAAAMHDAMRRSQQQAHLIAAVLAAPDAVMRTARVSGGGMASVVLSRREHMGVFTARRLRTLPSAMSYELWLMGPRGDRPAGMITAGKGTMAGPAVVSGMGAGDMIGLTIEPAGGSSQPTSPPLVMIGPAAGNSPQS
jgi:anti-sigma-K factor RskA